MTETCSECSLRAGIPDFTHHTMAGLPWTVKTRDNGVVYISKGFAQQGQFLSAIAKVPLPNQVVSVTPTLGNDWNGEPAVYFQIIISDNAVPRSRLLAFTKEISHTIVQHVRPLEEWGVLPY